jgi:hypothetical protein
VSSLPHDWIPHLPPESFFSLDKVLLPRIPRVSKPRAAAFVSVAPTPSPPPLRQRLLDLGAAKAATVAQTTAQRAGREETHASEAPQDDRNSDGDSDVIVID